MSGCEVDDFDRDLHLVPRRRLEPVDVVVLEPGQSSLEALVALHAFFDPAADLDHILPVRKQEESGVAIISNEIAEQLVDRVVEM